MGEKNLKRCVCVCVCVCIYIYRERERERDRQIDRQTDRQTERQRQREHQHPSACKPRLLQPMCLEPMICNKRSHHHKKPMLCN